MKLRNHFGMMRGWKNVMIEEESTSLATQPSSKWIFSFRLATSDTFAQIVLFNIHRLKVFCFLTLFERIGLTNSRSMYVYKFFFGSCHSRISSAFISTVALLLAKFMTLFSQSFDFLDRFLKKVTKLSSSLRAGTLSLLKMVIKLQCSSFKTKLHRIRESNLIHFSFFSLLHT